MPLTGARKKHLRALAHALKPVVQVGKQGLTPSLMATLDQALASHELVKVKFVDLKDQKREACAEITSQLGGEQVAILGHVAIFYRQAHDPEDRKIRLPDER